MSNTKQVTTDRTVPTPAPENLSNLLGVSRMMVAQSNLGQLLDVILTEATRLMSAERSSLFLLDEKTNQLRSFIAQLVTTTEIRLPVGKGIAGTVAKTGRSINLRDAYESELFDRSWDHKTGFRTRSVLCVPMLNVGNKITGVIQVLNKADGHFTEQDEATLTMFASHAATAIENIHLQEDLKLVFLSGIRALAQAVDSRDPSTAGHSERVTYYAVRIGEAMGLSPEEITALEYAATLHDIGKIAVPDRILTKDGKLTDEEYAVIKSHASVTREILQKFYFTGSNENVPLIAGAHHERMDGSGYPDSLTAKKLPLSARILAVADVYDAVTSFDRSYRKAMSPEEAVQLLMSEAGTTLDEQVVHTFVAKELFHIERRQFVRLDVHTTIEYRILPRDRFDAVITNHLGHTLDMSGNGLRFAGDDFIPVGSYLEVIIHLDEEEFEVLAKVVRIERVGRTHQFEISMAFVNLVEAAEHILQEHLISMAPV